MFRKTRTARLLALGIVSIGLGGAFQTIGRADTLPLGGAANYAVLYEGNGVHNLSISNVTINGNVGDGGMGVVKLSGPGTITGRMDIAAANTGQYSSSNGSNVGPTSVNYNVAAVTSALLTINSLSSSVGGLKGNDLAISNTQTISESDGNLQTLDGVNYRVFNVTSYSETDGKMLTINGDGSGDVVVLSFASTTGNVNLGGDVTLNGLTDDQVLWNFASSGKNISLTNNASSYSTVAFHGDILAPNDAISVDNSNLDGRVLGGDSSDMQIVSGDTIIAPTVAAPAPSALWGALAMLGGMIAWRRLPMATQN